MIPKTTPSRLKGMQQQQHIHARMPQTRLQVAKLLFFFACPVPGFSELMGGGGAPKLPANSGSRPIKVQSLAPSTNIGVRLSTRFCAIHSRICSALTGPYVLPSFPVIL